MAARRSNTKKTSSKPQGNGAPEPPSGFNDVGTPDIDAWLYPKEGTVVQGKIAGSFKIVDDRGERDVLLVKVRSLQNAVTMMDREEVDVGTGDILAIGVSHQLRDALAYVEHKGEFWCHYQGKKDIGHGQSMWKVRVACKGQRSAPPERELRTGGPAPVDNDDIPF